ncbi:1615_t:CDS:1, partial [Ambispora leptoticha]
QLSAALSRQHVNWLNISSTQYPQTSVPNANLHASESSHQLVDVPNLSSMETPINANLPASESSHQLADVPNLASMEKQTNANLPESKTSHQFFDVPNLSSMEYQISNADFV